MSRVCALWRHPIKGHGRESLESVMLLEGQTMPWDRRWAVAHELADVDGSAWAPCAAFSRGSKVAALMAINSQTDETTGRVTLTHPERPELTFDPETEADYFLEWVRPIMPQDRAQSARIVRVKGRGMTDTDYPSVSLINLASHNAVAARLDPDLSPLRWRCNIHMEGLNAWEEFEWVGKSIRVGEAELEIREPIERCLTTAANPGTGQRDLDTLGTLNTVWGHQDFGICGVVTKTGRISIGDGIELI